MTFKPELLSWLQYCTWQKHQKHPIIFINEPAKKKKIHLRSGTLWDV